MLRARFTRLDFPIINTSRLWFSTGNVSMSLLLPAELPCSTVPFPLQGCCSDCICFECCWEQGTFRRSWSKSWLSLFPLLCPFWPQLCHAKFMEQSTPCSWEYLLCSPRVVLLPFPPLPSFRPSIDVGEFITPFPSSPFQRHSLLHSPNAFSDKPISRPIYTAANNGYKLISGKTLFSQN